MSISYPKKIKAPIATSLCYVSNDLGSNLVNVNTDGVQFVAIVPPFFHKPKSCVVKLLHKVSPTKNRALVKDSTCIYQYYNNTLYTNNLINYREDTKRWLSDNNELEESKPYRYPVLAGHAKMMVVRVDKVIVCKYIVTVRSCKSDNDSLNLDMARNPNIVTLIHVSGDYRYIPDGYKVIKLKSDCWVCDGYYLTDDRLYIEPVTQYIPATNIKLCGDVVLYNIDGCQKTRQTTIADVNNLHHVVYRSKSGDCVKVTNNKVYL